jgi:ribosome biogenesis protein ERB1
VRERYERCLDLYLCPRKLKKRLNINPESLVPRLPHPRELKPFPNLLALQYLGHRGPVYTISLSPDGQYLASGGQDGTVRLWEVSTAYCMHCWNLGAPVSKLAFNPVSDHLLLAAAVGKTVVLISTCTSTNSTSVEMTEALLSAGLTSANKASNVDNTGNKDNDNVHNDSDDENSDNGNNSEGEEEEEDNTMKKKKHVSLNWKIYTNTTSTTSNAGPRLVLEYSHPVSSLCWHRKGDYLAVLCPSAGSAAVAIHQLSRASTQYPFNKAPGKVHAVLFHPTLPCLLVMLQQHIKIFNLVDQVMVKKLQSNCKFLSGLDVHPSGDHVIASSYDRRVVWFDLDMSSTPYKVLKYHSKAVRATVFSASYPLFASASDDGSVHVFHGRVFNSLEQNPVIVPLKILKEHGVQGELGVLSLAFHPKLPWLFSAGADGVINLYQDI